MPTTMHVLWNTHASTAGNNQSLLEKLEENPSVDLHHPGSTEDARKLATTLADDGAAIVVAAGGDGSVNCALEGLLESQKDCALGIIPLGTGNDFCRNANIPLDPNLAYQLLQTQSPRPIDVIRAESEDGIFHYLNMATAGNSGLYTDYITEEMKQFWGPMVYLRGAIDVIANLQTFQMKFRFDDEPAEELEILNLFLANGRVCGGGLPVAPDASIDDGLLDVIVVQDCSPVEMASLLTQYSLSDYREHESILFRRCRSLSLSSKSKFPVTADGDVKTDQPLSIKVLQHGLRVITGAPIQSEQ